MLQRRAILAASLLLSIFFAVSYSRSKRDRPAFEDQLVGIERSTLPLLRSLSTFSHLHPSLRVHKPWPTHRVSTPEELRAAFAFALPASNVTEPVFTLVGIASYESEFVAEWISFHRLVGVGRFILFDIVPGGDKGGDNPKSPAREGESLSDVLRPWREEGSVLLVEVEWEGGLPETWHRNLLELTEKYIFPHASWISNFDVDEFLLPPQSTVTSLSLSSRLPYVSPSDPESEWTFPFHERLRSLIEADCVPIWRTTFENVGVKELNAKKGDVEWETVSGVHIFRPNNAVRGQAGGSEWGKVLLHPEYEPERVKWGGPHNCVPLDQHDMEPDAENPFVVLDPYSGGSLGLYSGVGVALPEEGITLMHYYQRSLQNCFSKLDVLASGNVWSWRTGGGRVRCELDFLKAEDIVKKMPANLQEDRSVRDSWEGRMTRALVEFWRVNGRWKWQLHKEKDEDRKGVIRVTLPPVQDPVDPDDEEEEEAEREREKLENEGRDTFGE